MTGMPSDQQYPPLEPEGARVGASRPEWSTGTDPVPYGKAPPVIGIQRDLDFLAAGDDVPTDVVDAMRLGAQLLRALLSEEVGLPDEPTDAVPDELGTASDGCKSPTNAIIRTRR